MDDFSSGETLDLFIFESAIFVLLPKSMGMARNFFGDVSIVRHVLEYCSGAQSRYVFPVNLLPPGLTLRYFELHLFMPLCNLAIPNQYVDPACF